MSSDEQQVIGVDVGGTKILAGVLDRDGNIGAQHETPTPVTSQAIFLDALQSAVDALVSDRVAAVGFGIPSQVDQRTGRAYGSVNIPLAELDFRDFMSERFGLPVGIENDASAAALAEWAFGAGRRTHDMVMLTLGTGVGGGIVIDGQLYRGWSELGHMVIDHDGRPCHGACTGRGHVESYCTGTAATAFAREAFGPEDDAHALIKRAREGEEQAVEIVTDIGRRLGSAIGTLVNIFNPELVVIGGGFGAAAGDMVVQPAREVAAREALSGAHFRIVPAQLGNEAGLVGAGLIAFEALKP